MTNDPNPALAAQLSPATIDMIRRVVEWQAGNTPGTLTIPFETVFDAVVCTSLDDATVDARMAACPCNRGDNALMWTRVPDSKPSPCHQQPDTHRHIVYTVTDNPQEV